MQSAERVTSGTSTRHTLWLKVGNLFAIACLKLYGFRQRVRSNRFEFIISNALCLFQWRSTRQKIDCKFCITWYTNTQQKCKISVRWKENCTDKVGKCMCHNVLHRYDRLSTIDYRVVCQRLPSHLRVVNQNIFRVTDEWDELLKCCLSVLQK